jgi:signal transduction histidine kinase
MGLAAGKLSDWCASQAAAGDGQVRGLVDTIAEVAVQAQASCERLRGVVSNLRHFAQLDRAEVVRADIRTGLESTLRLLRHEFAERIRIVRDYAEAPEIECSPRELNQLFMNLLLNAKDAIEAAGRPGEIRVRTRALPGAIHVEISDNGCGIPAEHLDKIFDPGFTTKGVQVGTGLGLATCYQIVREHNGTIEVSSQPGEGAAFTVKLPSGAPG